MIDEAIIDIAGPRRYKICFANIQTFTPVVIQQKKSKVEFPVNIIIKTLQQIVRAGIRPDTSNKILNTRYETTNFPDFLLGDGKQIARNIDKTNI